MAEQTVQTAFKRHDWLGQWSALVFVLVNKWDRNLQPKLSKNIPIN
jgi:hypothetical protein